jgi:hypothetical protein
MYWLRLPSPTKVSKRASCSRVHFRWRSLRVIPRRGANLVAADFDYVSCATVRAPERVQVVMTRLRCRLDRGDHSRCSAARARRAVRLNRVGEAR